MAGVINPVSYKSLAPGTDLNTSINAGIYKLSGGYSNAPFPQTWGWLDVRPTGDGRTSQMIYDLSGSKSGIYFRETYDGTWKRIDNFGYNSLAELSAGVSPYLFAGVGNNSGLKSGTFTLKTGESISIALGAGVLMLFTDGGQVFSLLGINYWTTEIKTIYTDGRSLNITVTKNDTSGTVTFTAASNRKFHYIFFGE